MLNTAPVDLEDAKRIIKKANDQNKAITNGMGTVAAKLLKSMMVTNYNFTEMTRKRKQDVCYALGTPFKPYANEMTPIDEHLFDDDTMKRMKADLKKVDVKIKTTRGSSSKNGYGLGRSLRGGHHHQGNSKNSQNNRRNYNNSGHYNNNSRSSSSRRPVQRRGSSRN